MTELHLPRGHCIAAIMFTSGYRKDVPVAFDHAGEYFMTTIVILVGLATSFATALAVERAALLAFCRVLKAKQQRRIS